MLDSQYEQVPPIIHSSIEPDIDEFPIIANNTTNTCKEEILHNCEVCQLKQDCIVKGSFFCLD